MNDRQVLEQAIIDEMRVDAKLASLIAESLVDNGCKTIADQDHVDAFLYEFFFEEMPYGTKKARDGDPQEFICDRMSSMFEKELEAF